MQRLFLENHVLLHKSVLDSFWTLPGGRVQLFESSEDAISRELSEELGVQASVIRPLWYVEAFFDYEEKSFHEISSYYLTSLNHAEQIPFNTNYPGVEENAELIFRWMALEELEKIEIKPTFLQKKTSKDFNRSRIHTFR